MLKQTIDTIMRKKILESIPRILGLLDKNPLSDSFGCLDRKYWHYKIIDFPSGMQQELIIPLAYVWLNDFEGNEYFQVPRIREYIDGILSYHGRSIHKDGSLDDYFPYERAFGATAYALAALTETVIMLGETNENVLVALERSGSFLAGYREAGKLSNHLAIAALALANLHLITGKDKYEKTSAQMLSELFSRQHEEGWFPEYEGCDLGYQTVTAEFLARCYKKKPTDRLLNVLKKNLQFLVNFIHPDGSLGGEYGSRNTYNFYPGGFSVLSGKIPEASKILAGFFTGLSNGSNNFLEDDGVFSHLLSSYVTVLECQDLVVNSGGPEQISKEPKIKYFPGAGLYLGEYGLYKIFGNTTKGGVYKIFKGQDLVFSDTGFAGELTDGRKFCQNKAKTSSGVVEDYIIDIEGSFQKFSLKRLRLIQMVGLRVLASFFGWLPFYSNGIRFLMQKLLIYNRDNVGIKYRRKITLSEGRIMVRDEFFLGSEQISSIYRTTDCVNMHVITSDSFQKANLLSWEKMETGDSLVFTKIFEVDNEQTPYER